ncbi:hypothetical protein HOLleu_00247 [Holothuria leucospilota]|uniref:Uncharacterized protein n=1 Tax=Holothuria leucospilota TaxID=206669 RepID=A0A9Q1HK46_HOLLE|nr:hypothetical protein HOLleu_00247 [Holothuria leucospilota]
MSFLSTHSRSSARSQGPSAKGYPDSRQTRTLSSLPPGNTTTHHEKVDKPTTR